MSTFLRPSFDWRVLYRIAILETDRSIIPQRIAEAERAILSRGRQMFYSHASLQEHDALEDSLYALRVYRAALQHWKAEHGVDGSVARLDKTSHLGNCDKVGNAPRERNELLVGAA